MNSTMDDADGTCEFLLNLIRKSNLNYFVEETSFSVSIKIKKTFIKNKDVSLRTKAQRNMNNHKENPFLRNIPISVPNVLASGDDIVKLRVDSLVYLELG